MIPNTYYNKTEVWSSSPFSPKTRGIIECEIEHGIIWPHVTQCMFINTIPVVTIYNSNLPLIWSSRMSSGYLALKWQGVRPPGMDCCMRVIIMFIKLCWDSLSWWINVARLRSRDGAQTASITSKETSWATLNWYCILHGLTWLEALEKISYVLRVAALL